MQCCPVCYKPFDFLVHSGEVIVCKECSKILMEQLKKFGEVDLNKPIKANIYGRR